MKKAIAMIFTLVIILSCAPAALADCYSLPEVWFDYDNIRYSGCFYVYPELGIEFFVPDCMYYEEPTDNQYAHGVLAVFWTADYSGSMGLIHSDAVSRDGWRIRSFDDLCDSLSRDPNVDWYAPTLLNGLMTCIYYDLEYDSMEVVFLDGNGGMYTIECTPASDFDLMDMWDFAISGIGPSRY